MDSPDLSRRGALGLGLAGLALPLAARAAPAGFVAEGGFDRAAFDTWVSMRTGTGRPIYWYSEGTVRAYPSGKLLFFMEGFDTARSHRPDPARPLAHQYNRKIYVFRDAESGAILRDWQGKTVEPIAYPYQFITYELKGDRVETWVEQGTAPRVQRIGPGSSMAVRRLGSTMVFTAPVYLDFPIPGTDRRYEAFENYDFVADTRRPLDQAALSWVRTGAAPAWAGGVPCVMHLVTRRIDRWADVPEGIRRYVETEQPLWRDPPRDLDDIRRLQGA